MNVINPIVLNAAKRGVPWALKIVGAGAIGAGLGAAGLGAAVNNARTQDSDISSPDNFLVNPDGNNQEILLKAQLELIQDQRRKENNAAQKLLKERIIQSYQAGGY